MSKVADTFRWLSVLTETPGVYFTVHINSVKNTQIRIALSKARVLYDMSNFSLEAHLC